MTKPLARTCRECSTPLPAEMKASSEFCNDHCRISWRNRRMSRGADLYDCFMALRYDREAAKAHGLWALMCRMAQAWNEEDQKAGRKRTYFPPHLVRQRNTRHVATVVVKGKKR